MQVRSSSEARKEFQDVINHVHYTKRPIIISKRDKPWVMIQPLPESDVDLKKILALHKKGRVAKKKQ